MPEKNKIHEFKNLIFTHLPFSANPDQVDAIEKISDFVFDLNERSVFILRGYAGTGKTNLISAFTRALPYIKWRSVLLAPTGRAAKVLSLYSQRQALTIHKKIFKKQLNSEGGVSFSLAENLHRNTIFVVDEASMIGAGSEGENVFTNLLESLFEYVYSGENCKLILIGDTAQLPPVGSSESPALNPEYLKHAFYLNIQFYELKEVARQRLKSGILLNATNLREAISNDAFQVPKLRVTADFVRLAGDELEDTLNSCLSAYGEDNVLIVTRSNKRANLFNQSFRQRIKVYEDDLCTGDRIMIVKNNYYWLPESAGGNGFIANGDMAEITRIINREEVYGFHFCECVLRFTDYPELQEQQVKLLTDSLYSNNPALSSEEQKNLYQAVMEDVREEPSKWLKMGYLKKSPYYNALQVKFSYAITCHKAQGGQWPVVFIDQGYLKEEEIDPDFLRWLYTAITRASEKIYLINFNDLFFS